MVIDDFYVKRVAIAKLETDPPGPIHSHRPLSFTLSPELVETNALEWAQILKALGGIQSKQQINGMVEIQAAESGRPLAFPYFAAYRVPPSLNHGNNILRVTVKGEYADAFSVKWAEFPWQGERPLLLKGSNSSVPPRLGPTDEIIPTFLGDHDQGGAIAFGKAGLHESIARA